MSKNSPHTQLRHALIDDHLAKGWVDAQMFTAYSVILRQADFGTGVWHGSADKLAAACQWSKSTANRALNKLIKGRYIVSQHMKDVRGNYDVLINNFVPTAGHMKGKKIRRVKTVDYRSDSLSGSESDSPLNRYGVTGEPLPIQTSDSPVARVQYVVVPAAPEDPVGVSPLPTEYVQNNNNSGGVVVVPPSPLDVAGYTPEAIAAQAEQCKNNPWVRRNDSLNARKREGYVRHLMTLDPPRAVRTGCSKCGKRVEADAEYCDKCMSLPHYRRESGQRTILKGDI